MAAYAPVQNSSSPNLVFAPSGPQTQIHSPAASPAPSIRSSPSFNNGRAPFPRGKPPPPSTPRSSSMAGVPGAGRPSSFQPSISEKFHLAPDPAGWGLDISHAEPDDALHDPRRTDQGNGGMFSGRGFENVGCLVLLCLCIVGLLYVLSLLPCSLPLLRSCERLGLIRDFLDRSLGYPVTSHFMNPSRVSLLNVNASGQIPNIGNWGLIDLDTPKSEYNIYSYHDPSKTLQLVFSDEFETDGRSFYPGDDPYWEAVDLHYWQTGDLEWYDPSAISTKDGALHITLSKVEDPADNHNMSYKSGMMSTWNKFCFTGGLIVANVMLPGTTNVFGLWPAIWTMGNLGRAGYGASLDGMWPYVYDACDVGTVANQTLNGGPPAALTSGGGDADTLPFRELSYLPGQRLSRCTCMGESHPGPVHSDGTYVGRSAPEIDILEAQIGGSGTEDDPYLGQVSQSAQWAPFNKGYIWANTSDNLIIPDPTLSHQNSFSGSEFQQATSVVSTTNQSCYQLTEQCFAVNGFEYLPGYGDAYISWITNNKVSWTLNVAGVGADAETQIAARPVPGEPMYILANLGISHAFGFVDFQHLTFPSVMQIDWIRVYQDPDNINVGCDTTDFPTQAYINTYIEAYTNQNLTTWVDDYKQTIPKNKLVDQC
ncbi:GH16 domain-containing protein [Mycena sanguinolenta]|uniref:GH16 domain-containing protein n=1 Tax=Mycena sanguinolenta TaxID=230812 RepID=A0A8H7CQB9_9AGAR|nr:GH16 domain-containing protein [Mycena sanguinolenta]